MSRYQLSALSLVALIAVGCTQQPSSDVTSDAPINVSEPPVVERVERAPPPTPVETPRYEEPKLTDTRVIYFDFDRSEVRREDRPVVQAHAEWLADTGARVRLEGHADERGSREYNIGLGERRAQAIRQALMLQGVQGSQIETLSYGEERPANRGQGEFAWQQNRRVEIVYLP